MDSTLFLLELNTSTLFRDIIIIELREIRSLTTADFLNPISRDDKKEVTQMTQKQLLDLLSEKLLDLGFDYDCLREITKEEFMEEFEKCISVIKENYLKEL